MERIIDKVLRENATISEFQLGFVAGKGTIDAISIVYLLSFAIYYKRNKKEENKKKIQFWQGRHNSLRQLLWARNSKVS